VKVSTLRFLTAPKGDRQDLKRHCARTGSGVAILGRPEG
jgi:hypothetical protein